MFIFVITFLLGNLYLQTFSALPNSVLVILLLITTISVYFVFKKHWTYSYLPLAFALGFSWSYGYAISILNWELPAKLEGKPMVITGYIASIPNHDDWQTNFIFSLRTIQFDQHTQKVHSQIKLSWRPNHQHNTTPKLRVGDKWRFVVRLKRIHSTQNPGTFDYEAWSLQKGLRANGYVIVNEDNKRLSHSLRYPMNQIRQHLQDKIQENLPISNVSPWLIALIMGERNNIAHDDWQVLRNTGTNHLMAIAGLHIGMIAGFMHVIFSWLWRRSSILSQIIPAQHAGASAALFTALLYSALAGFSIPTQRACIMLCVFIMALMLKRLINAWHSWSLAVLLVLLLNPLSVLTESFWLSFCTIGLIIYGMSARLSPSGLWWKWGKVQWVIGVGLIPLTLFFYQQCSLISFIANTIAIPWLGCLILPFCFLSSISLFISPWLGKLLLIIADYNLTGLWMVLTWLSQLTISSWHQIIPNLYFLIITIIGFLCLLLPLGFPGRWLGIIWLLPIILYQPLKPALGDFWLTLLDVGQGLAVVVQTHEHVVVYDAGPKLNDHVDMGESVVLPYLYTINAKRIDMLVVSHGDNDHIGGVNTLLKSLPIKSIKTSVPAKIPSSIANYCLRGDSFSFDHVNFTFIYPTMNNLNLGNDSSCVLRIDNGKKSVLLTGDIEKYAETILLANDQSQLMSTILIAPHHGSKTSGVSEFIKAVHPQIVLYATGYRNRYHFPHPSIVDHYNHINAMQFNTTNTGGIQFKLNHDYSVIKPNFYRVLHQRYWMN